MANDRETWQKILQHDAAAFDSFYRENAPRLLAFLRQIVRDSQTSEELMQETFAQIWTKPGGFDPERGSLRSYLYGVARKRAAGWWRRQRPFEVADEANMGTCEPEARSLVNDALKRLPPEQRALLWLREAEGYSYVELAGILDIPVGTVRSRLFTAREALRTIWRGAHNEGERRQA